MNYNALPNNGVYLGNYDLTPQLSPSYTWRVDFKNDKIAGYVDDEEALKQAIILALSTPAGKYEIYPDDYGMDLKYLIGQPADLARIRLPKLIEECLLQDLRIDTVEVTNIESVGNTLRCKVTCNGNIKADYEVEI